MQMSRNTWSKLHYTIALIKSIHASGEIQAHQRNVQQDDERRILLWRQQPAPEESGSFVLWFSLLFRVGFLLFHALLSAFACYEPSMPQWLSLWDGGSKFSARFDISISKQQEGGSIQILDVGWCKEESMLLEVVKYDIMHHVGIHAGDFSILDPLLSYPSTILGQEPAIVLNLEERLLSVPLL